MRVLKRVLLQMLMNVICRDYSKENFNSENTAWLSVVLFHQALCYILLLMNWHKLSFVSCATHVFSMFSWEPHLPQWIMYLTTKIYHCHSVTIQCMRLLFPRVSENCHLWIFVSMHPCSRCYMYIHVLHSWKWSATDEMCDVNDITSTWRQGFAFLPAPVGRHRV